MKRIVLVVLLSSVAFFSFVIVSGRVKFGKASAIEYSIAKESFENEPRTYIPDTPVIPDTQNAVNSTLFFPLENILCPTADSCGFRVHVSLMLEPRNKMSLSTLKNKEEGVRKLVQFTFSKMLLSQIEMESVKQLILDRVNSYLVDGSIVSVKFTKFDIVPPETP